MKDVRKLEWVSKSGSIFTKQSFENKLERNTVNEPISIAFNVGQTVADHMVKVHNESLGIKND